jgi:cytochrome b561
MRHSRESRWPFLVRLLHWLAAAAILVMLALGFAMVNLVENPGERFDLYQVHKSLGLLVLVLMLARIALRLLYAPPAPIASAPNAQRRAAVIVHGLLYVLTVALILVGYAQVSSSPLPLPIAAPFGLEAPNLLAPDFARSEVLKQVHHGLAALLAFAIVLHVAAALKRRFLDRDETLRRMSLF